MASCSVRRLIGSRTPPDWIAFGVRSDFVRRPIRLRTVNGCKTQVDELKSLV